MKKILKNKQVILFLAFAIVVTKRVKNWFKQSVTKRAVVATAAASAVVIIGVGATFALLRVQAQGEVTNAFQSAKINVQVVEENPAGGTVESDINNEVDFGSIQKNEERIKKVQIENVHSEEYPTTDTFVRCRIVPVLRDAEGNNIATKVDFSIAGTDDTWKEYTEENGEKYYYWTKVLPKEAKTGYLFESVTVTSEIPTGAHLELQVIVDAVQARPYASAEDKEKTAVYTAWGWYYDTSDETLKK